MGGWLTSRTCRGKSQRRTGVRVGEEVEREEEDKEVEREEEEDGSVVPFSPITRVR